MAQPYNITAISRSQTLAELIINADELSGNLLGTLFVVTAFIIAFIVFKANYEGKRAFAGASFLTALFSIFIGVLGLTSDKVMFGCFILAGVSFALLRWGD